MRRWMLTVGLALAACSQGEAPAEAPQAAEAAAPLPPGRAGVYQAAGQGPEAFVRALYALYTPQGTPTEPPPEPGRDPLYSRILNALIGEDSRKAQGDAPAMNFDPICNCQDGGNFSLDSVAVTETGPNRADAAVVFTNAGETKRQTLKLVKEGPNWKVDDVVTDDGALSEMLYAAIR